MQDEIKGQAEQYEEQIEGMQRQIELQEESINAMEGEKAILQSALDDKELFTQELEKKTEFLQGKDHSIQQTIEKLKSKYKQKIVDKESEVGRIKVDYLTLQNEYHQSQLQVQQYMKQVDNLTQQTGQLQTQLI